MAERILLLFLGYIKIRLSGYATGRFMNLCMKHHIKIWGVCNHGSYDTLYMGCRSFKEIKPIVKKTKTKVVILEKRGLPFFMFRYRKRKLFFVGVLVFVCLLYVMSLFIWEIELAGNRTYATEELLKFLGTKEVRYGMVKQDVDCAFIEKELRSAYTDITWASARVEGTKLMIELKENEISEQTEVKQEQAGSLYANHEGQITKMITRVGVPQVALHDTVSKGQILISGVVPVYGDDGAVKKYQYVHADGDIAIRTHYQYEDSFPLKHTEIVKTGNVRKSISLTAFYHEFDFRYKKSPYKSSETLEETHHLRLSRYFYLPFSITVQTIVETQKKEVVYTKEEALVLGQKRLLKFVADLEEKGVQIIEKNVKIGMSGKYCVAKGTILLVTEETLRKPFKENKE